MVRSVLSGLGATVAIVVVLFIPIIVMLRLPPGGFPTPLPDWLGLLLFVLAGIVIGLLLQVLRNRLVGAGIATFLVLLLAFWFQRGRWWIVDAVPAPPVLPLLLRDALVPAAGILLGALVVAILASRAGPPSADGAEAAVPESVSTSLVAGVMTAAAVIAVTEVTLWGNDLLRTTFEGPWGLDRSSWLRLVFIATLVPGALVGWISTSRVRRPAAPAVTAVLVLLVAAAVWVLGDGLGGPPRTLLYGLALGVTAVAALSPYARRLRIVRATRVDEGLV